MALPRRIDGLDSAAAPHRLQSKREDNDDDGHDMTTPADFADRLAVVQDAEQVLNRVDLNAPEAEATQPPLCCVTSDGGAAHRIALSLIEADPTD